MSATAGPPGPTGSADVPTTLEVRSMDPPSDVPRFVLDLAVGASASIATVAVATTRRGTRVLGPVARLGLHPPLVPARHHPARYLVALARRGEQQSRLVAVELSRLLDRLVPLVVSEAVRRMDLTALVSQYVNVDEVVAGVDLDAAAARLDVDAIAQRLDIDAVLDRLDLTGLVRERVDLELLVAMVDLDAAASRLDVDAVAARLDVEAVIDRVDLVGLAEEVINAIDLPQIIRDSSGAVASDTVREVRMQGIAGDEAVGRVVDRLLRRTPKNAPPVEVVIATDGVAAQDGQAAQRPGDG